MCIVDPLTFQFACASIQTVKGFIVIHPHRRLVQITECPSRFETSGLAKLGKSNVAIP